MTKPRIALADVVEKGPDAVNLDFIRSGELMEIAHIESLNGRLRDECLNVTQFISLDDARAEIEASESITIGADPTRLWDTLHPASAVATVRSSGPSSQPNSGSELSTNGISVKSVIHLTTFWCRIEVGLPHQVEGGGDKELWRIALNESI